MFIFFIQNIDWHILCCSNELIPILITPLSIEFNLSFYIQVTYTISLMISYKFITNDVSFLNKNKVMMHKKF